MNTLSLVEGLCVVLSTGICKHTEARGITGLYSTRKTQSGTEREREREREKEREREGHGEIFRRRYRLRAVQKEIHTFGRRHREECNR